MHHSHRSLIDLAREDLAAARRRDPAARSSLEVALLYPGVHALWAHRAAHRLWHTGHKFAARALAQAARAATGIEIHPAAKIGANAVLVKNLPADHVGVGVPARVRDPRTDPELMMDPTIYI